MTQLERAKVIANYDDLADTISRNLVLQTGLNALEALVVLGLAQDKVRRLAE